MESYIWAERYRPRQYEDYVWRDETLKAKFLSWVRDRAVPHVLFSGDPGVGKTTLAHLVLSTIGIPKEDILYIPASRERKIDDIIDRIRAFVQTWSFGETGLKYVILDEADTISVQAQMALRADMEIFESVRFILTANYPGKIIGALQSRVEAYHFSGLDHDAYTMRLVEVMQAERIDVTDIANIQAMVAISNRFYPDLRKSIGMLQQGCSEDADGRRRLLPPKADDVVITKPFLIKAFELIKAGNLRGARLLIVKSASTDEYTDVYRWIYKNLDLFGKTEDQKDEVLLAVRKGLVHHAVVADPEINLSATLCEICMIAAKSD